MPSASNPTKQNLVQMKNAKLIQLECTFPLTGQKCVSRIITELAVFDVDFMEGLTLIEVAEGVTVDEVKSKTEAPFKVKEPLGVM